MKLSFHTRKLCNFSIETRENILYKLTIPGILSRMKDRIHKSLRSNIDDIAIICKHKDIVIAWACIIDYKRIMVYVKPAYRKNKIGSALLKRSELYLINKGLKQSTISPWNYQAARFFKSNGYNNSGEYIGRKEL